MLAARCRVADRPWSRLCGLLGRSGMEAGEGLLIEPTSSIHMFGMRFAIDAVFLDRENTVLRVVEQLRPWRMAARRGTRRVLELPVGAAGRAGVEIGDRLVFEPPSTT